MYTPKDLGATKTQRLSYFDQYKEKIKNNIDFFNTLIATHATQIEKQKEQAKDIDALWREEKGEEDKLETINNYNNRNIEKCNQDYQKYNASCFRCFLKKPQLKLLTTQPQK